jgi:ribose transport system permease protein
MIRRLTARPERLVPAVSLLAASAAFLATPLISGSGLTTFDFYNTLQGFAQLGLLALALGLTMIAGEFDLSVAGTYALGGMLAVQTGQSSAVLGLVTAVAAGAAIGAVQGGLIAWLRLPSLPVTLATYIALLGLTSAMSGGLSKTYTNSGASLWVDQATAGVLSPRSLITLAAFAAAAVILGCTKLGRELRAVGGDRRASRVAGIRVGRVLAGLFTVSGALAALGGALLSYSFASANPDPGLQPLILGAVACLLGGVSLAGGRGLPPGLLTGALSVALLAQIVAITKLPDYYSELLYATLLVIVVAVDAPGLRDGLERLRTRARAADTPAAGNTRPPGPEAVIATPAVPAASPKEDKHG